jgi:hypothetical protein
MNTAAIANVAPLAQLEHTLARGGWRVNTIDLDLQNGAARVEVIRTDGLRVTLDARQGRASVTREILSSPALENRNLFNTRKQTDVFLGRIWAEGPRHGLKIFCDYIADNAMTPLLPIEVRRTMALCMAPNALQSEH